MTQNAFLRFEQISTFGIITQELTKIKGKYRALVFTKNNSQSTWKADLDYSTACLYIFAIYQIVLYSSSYPIFDLDTWEPLYPIGDDMAVDASGHFKMRMNGGMAMDLDTLEMQFTTPWDIEDSDSWEHSVSQSFY